MHRHLLMPLLILVPLRLFLELHAHLALCLLRLRLGLPLHLYLLAEPLAHLGLLAPLLHLARAVLAHVLVVEVLGHVKVLVGYVGAAQQPLVGDGGQRPVDVWQLAARGALARAPARGGDFGCLGCPRGPGPHAGRPARLARLGERAWGERGGPGEDLLDARLEALQALLRGVARVEELIGQAYGTDKALLEVRVCRPVQLPLELHPQPLRCEGGPRALV
mmetsp:Transcript_44947/g.143115  ORF Transcript_44947/g.143115 Transcript_44947/m.143115 type:complete len:220 (-) Transcript_44947:449-1108(-)